MRYAIQKIQTFIVEVPEGISEDDVEAFCVQECQDGKGKLDNAEYDYCEKLD